MHTYNPVLKKGSDFREEITKGIELLESARLIVQRLETEREYVFEGLFRDMGSYHTLIFDSLGYSEKGKHDFQWFIAQRATNALQFYARRAGLEGELTIVPSTPNTFPCQFLVKWGESSVLRVNLMKKVYGKSSKSYQEGQQTYIQSLEKDIQDYQALLTRNKEISLQPWKHVHSWKDVVDILTKRYLKVIESNNTFFTERIELFQKNKEEAIELLQKNKEADELCEQQVEKLRPFFLSFGFEEIESGSHSLY